MLRSAKPSKKASTISSWPTVPSGRSRKPGWSVTNTCSPWLKRPMRGCACGNTQLSLVDELLEDAGLQNVPAEFLEKRERLKNLAGILPVPVPQGFTGELRPYQKAGLDWLHFLHEYGFGGCLADDMGLGKTIQVLAFLQSLKEQAQVRSAARPAGGPQKR